MVLININPHCNVKTVNSLLWNGEPLPVKTSAGVPSISMMSDGKAITVGALIN